MSENHILYNKTVTKDSFFFHDSCHNISSSVYKSMGCYWTSYAQITNMHTINSPPD